MALAWIKDPTEARAIGFFYIVQIIKQFQKMSDFTIFHIGRTTVIIPEVMIGYFQEGIQNTESIQEYLTQVESGYFLSPAQNKVVGDYGLR
jgi:hypothetical protein